MLPPPEANPRMTANPDPPSASRPAPPAVNFNMSRRVNRASYNGSMLEHPPKSLAHCGQEPRWGAGRDNRSVSRARRARIRRGPEFEVSESTEEIYPRPPVRRAPGHELEPTEPRT